VHKTLLTLALFSMTATAAIAAPSAGSAAAPVMATLHQFLGGAVKGDEKSAVAACASSVSILDDFPPHVWQGPTACADWFKAFTASDDAAGVTDGAVTLGTPWRVDVTGNLAYAVVPASFSYKVHGKPVTESGNVYTAVLRKTPAGWRIIAWAWSRH
jgi:ketosteroid isomerase-like protein